MTAAGLMDQNGNPASLDEGDLIHWNCEVCTLAVTKRDGQKIFYHTVLKKDDKVYLGPMAYANIFAMVSFVAATHGYTIRTAMHDDKHRCIWELVR
jgi:hypothetical protein